MNLKANLKELQEKSTFGRQGFQKVLGSESSVDSDLEAASTLLLRLVMSIAKVYSLEASEWQALSWVCGKALRQLPGLYRLQRRLPGALNDARALRGASQPSELFSVNPWCSEEGIKLFESSHGVAWEDMKDSTALGSVYNLIIFLSSLILSYIINLDDPKATLRPR